MIKISIIVPCYNQGKYLDETLQSVSNQTFVDWECIIVNDGSPDNTEEIALLWTAKDNRFKYVKKENGGLSSARNFGIANALGEFILPLDSDDKIAPAYISLALEAFESDKSLKVVYCKAEKFGKESGEWILDPFSLHNLMWSNLIFCSALFRKTEWEKVGGFDTNMIYGYEDWEFWISVLKNGGSVKCIPEIGFYYRTKSSSMLKGIDLKKRYKSFSYVFFKHKDLYQNYIEDYNLSVNINFSYCFYLSAKTYQRQEKQIIKIAKEQYRFRLNKELSQYSFFKRKKVLFYWYRIGKLNLNFLNFLTY